MFTFADTTGCKVLDFSRVTSSPSTPVTITVTGYPETPAQPTGSPIQVSAWHVVLLVLAGYAIGRVQQFFRDRRSSWTVQVTGGKHRG